jgi:hypothetical protein
LDLTLETYSLVLQGRQEIADELKRVEADQGPHTGHDAATMREMLTALDIAIANYHAPLH